GRNRGAEESIPSSRPLTQENEADSHRDFFSRRRETRHPAGRWRQGLPGRGRLVRLGWAVVQNNLIGRLADRLVGGRGACRAATQTGSAGASPSPSLDGLREAAMTSDPSAVLQGLLARLAAGDQAARHE